MTYSRMVHLEFAPTLCNSSGWTSGLSSFHITSAPAPRLRNPVQGGHRFHCKADSNPVIADSR